MHHKLICDDTTYYFSDHRHLILEPNSKTMVDAADVIVRNGVFIKDRFGVASILNDMKPASPEKIPTVPEESAAVLHPIQPLVTDERGVIRFKRNAIVDFLIEQGEEHGFGLNDLSRMKFPREDWVQLAQLIGYSLYGFGTLSYVDNNTYEAACLMKYGKSEKDARIEALSQKLEEVREAFRTVVPSLFQIHKDDLIP